MLGGHPFHFPEEWRSPTMRPNPEMEHEPTRKQTIYECPVCGARHFTYLFAVDSHRLVRCRECEFALLNPQPSDSELRQFRAANPSIDNDGPDDAHRSSLNQFTAEAYLDVLLAYSGIARGRFLQIGCTQGAILAAAGKRGFRVSGVASSEEAAKRSLAALAAASVEPEFLSADAEALAHQPAEYDICVLDDTLGQVRDPKRLLQRVHQLLRPGGVILVAAPGIDSRSTGTGSVRGRQFSPDRLSYFSRQTLESLLFAQGFRTLSWMSGAEVMRFELPPTSQAEGRSDAPRSARGTPRRGAPGSMVVLGRRSDLRDRARLSFIIPVYNEAGSVAQALDRLLEHPFPETDVEFVIVESNSTDGTREIVQRYADRPGVRLILEDRPRGKGYAVRTGLRVASGDFIAIQDADLEYDLEDYAALLDPLIHHREAFVLGARHGGRARKMRQFVGQPITSSVLNFGHWFFTTLLNVCFFVRLRDPFTMYKLFRLDCIHGLEFECNRFDFDWEIVIKLIRRGYIPLEIPVNYRSRSFKEGKKVSLIRDPLTWLRAVVRFRIARIPRWARPAAATETSIGDGATGPAATSVQPNSVP